MMRLITIIKLILPLLSIRCFASELQHPNEIIIEAGEYYVGSAFGKNEYDKMRNVKLSSFSVMSTPISFKLYELVRTQAKQYGYILNEGCNGSFQEECRASGVDMGSHPVTNIEWSDAVVFSNALSELTGLEPVYVNPNGTVVRVSTSYIFKAESKNGYRLPSLEEWHIAARGGRLAITSGSYGDVKTINNRTGTDKLNTENNDIVALKKMGDGVAEWVSTVEYVGGIRMYAFCGSGYVSSSFNRINCDYHSSGYMMPDVSFRLIRYVK